MTTLCDNCMKPIVKGEIGRDILDLDGSFVNREVEVLLDEDKKWYDATISSFEPSLEGKMAQFYCITFRKDGHKICGFRFSNYKVRFM